MHPEDNSVDTTGGLSAVECARGVVAFQRYLESLVAGWTPGRREGLVDCLVQARDDEDGGSQLSVQEVADQLLSLIVGGHLWPP